LGAGGIAVELWWRGEQISTAATADSLVHVLYGANPLDVLNAANQIL